MVIAVPHDVGARPRIRHEPLVDSASAVVGRAALLQTVEPAAAAALASHLRRVHFWRHHQIYREGDIGECLYIVAAGKVKLGRQSPDGRSHLLTIAGPSEMFGELSIFDPGPRTATATCLTEVDAVALERNVFRALVVQHPEIADRLLRILARRLRRTDDDLSDLVFTDVASRVAKQLLRLAQRFGVQENGALRVTHNLTQGEIAQLTGTTRESINKILADFAQHGWIRLDRRSMLITDTESLVRHARRGESSTATTHPDRSRA